MGGSKKTPEMSLLGSLKGGWICVCQPVKAFIIICIMQVDKSFAQHYVNRSEIMGSLSIQDLA